MKISDRFTDYGLIGGFFWILQFSTWTLFGFFSTEWNTLFSQTKSLLTGFPDPTLTAGTALLGALAVVLIFTTGLLIDLLGAAYWSPQEATIFIANIRTNKLWLKGIVDNNQQYIQKDWIGFIKSPAMVSKTRVRVAFRGLLFWNAGYRQEYVNAVRSMMSVSKAYKRFQAFLLSYVLLKSSETELLSTQISLWNLGRAIAMCMSLATLTPLLIFYINPPVYLTSLWQMYLILIVLTGGAFAVARSAYSRVCSTLFAHAYVISSAETQNSR